jgi:hypothetical protein
LKSVSWRAVCEKTAGNQMKNPDIGRLFELSARIMARLRQAEAAFLFGKDTLNRALTQIFICFFQSF